MTFPATDRLRFRDFAAADFEAVHAYASDPEVVRHMTWGPNSEQDTRDYLERVAGRAAAEPRKSWEVAVIEKASGQVVGGVGLDADGPQGTLGYCFRRQSWGRGYATEAARAAIDFGFRELGLHRIEAGCDPRNVASARVLEKVGMRREGRRREDTEVRAEWRDSLLYGVLAREWERARPAGASASPGPHRAVDLARKLAAFRDLWAPRVVAELNDYQLKVARIEGEFVWHAHPGTDEAFIVLDGEMAIELRDGRVELAAGQMYVVPKGVEHRPVARRECHILLVEPRGVVNTGDAGGSRTAEGDVWV